MNMTSDEVEAALTQLGWKTQVALQTRVRRFQEGWQLGPPLTIDGIAGDKTGAAILVSLNRLRQRKGTASRFFSFHEFACKCANLPGCEGVRVRRELLDGLDIYREKWAPAGLPIVSGYRCPPHNAKSGGADQSQHQWGAAADVTATVKAADVLALRKFSGIGTQRTPDGLVRHVDVRHVTDAYTSTGTPTAPSRWVYS